MLCNKKPTILKFVLSFSRFMIIGFLTITPNTFNI